jgi:hypothetical protein
VGVLLRNGFRMSNMSASVLRIIALRNLHIVSLVRRPAISLWSMDEISHCNEIISAKMREKKDCQV